MKNSILGLTGILLVGISIIAQAEPPAEEITKSLGTAFVDIQIQRLIDRTRFAGTSIDELIESEAFEDIWYRDLRIGAWIWQGIDRDLIRLALARVLAADARLDPQHFQDVDGNYVDTFGGDDREGAWTREWSNSAAESLRGLRFAPPATQRRLLQEASVLFTIASYPHLRGQQASRQAFERANDAYRRAGELMAPALVTLRVPFDDGQTAGEVVTYLHRPAEFDGPVPVVMISGGVDVVLTEHFPAFEDLAAHGMAMLAMDLPGIGNSEAWPTTPDQTSLHREVVSYLVQFADQLGIDPERIAVIGSSMGGNAATKAAFESSPDFPVWAAVNRCGATGSVFSFPLEAYAFGFPHMTTDAAASLLGVDYLHQVPGEPDTFEPLRTAITALSLYEQGFLAPWFEEVDGVLEGPLDEAPDQPVITSVPILSINTADDDIGSVADMETVAAASAAGSIRLHPEYEDHCEPRAVGFPYIAWWLSEQR